ncbi:type II toxin-antitoxin system RelE/ParE family toxin [Parabacteroides acidifaciens]|uniref:Type II toxin-antitoxin system RelE/ParE family toxin n=1 Tax=Parabacteroides acidifaciens TaxID=2290935 RepID=A0A3D8HCZ9_9BACT|nr:MULTISPECIES: type II toxin-antitoxin system RelE/ParE family toxin [Parabacteroides]MBC8602454.1 type II toxin-antitoxin system RelE/ParE family toxin [Parabacteroides acidifaciens]RDU48863.1 type II toxin-antitoxin system RelE/ParE family toxin [Parabacteroides acidifaciens]RHO74583.1 type II toxin-antitoxin system RelE/ParE family toxin [Parabacteroides sp. AF48-14]
MVEIKWTNFAIQNLNDIGNYIEQNSYRQASRVVNYLFDSVSILENFPLSGRVVPEYNVHYIRELIRSNYRIVYLVLNDSRIDILTVHHSAQLLPDLPVLYSNSELSP